MASDDELIVEVSVGIWIYNGGIRGRDNSGFFSADLYPQALHLGTS